jgi:septal ring factor EnvC (AmiA/AmiB activator)
VTLLLSLASPPVPAQSDDPAERLARLRSEIEEREERARELAGEAEGYLAELEAIDLELTETRGSVRRLRKQLAGAEADRRRLEARLAESERSLTATRTALGARLVALYKFGSVGGFSSVYAGGDFQTLLRRSDSLRRVLAEDSRLFAEHGEARRAWLEARDSNRRLVTELGRTREALTGRQDRIRQALVERKNAVALLRTRADRERRAASELRTAAKRLERTLEELSGDAPPSPGDGLLAGRVPDPIEGGIVRLGFGRVVDPEFGTETVRNGIEFEAPLGTPVRAVGDGRVLFAGWFRGYGQIVILDHGDRSVTVSGNLDELAVQAGDAVRRGENIGTVGQTGSLRGPGLYFEIRHAGTPVDPRPWLASSRLEGTQ